MSSTVGKGLERGIGAIAAMIAVNDLTRTSLQRIAYLTSDINRQRIPKQMHAESARPVPPRQLSTDRKSLHYDPCYTRVEVEFDGEMRKNDVHAYDVDEGWIDVRVRRADGRYRLDASGKFVLQRLHGVVVPSFKRVIAQPPIKQVTVATAPHDDVAAQKRAAEKQARKQALRIALAERNATR